MSGTKTACARPTRLCTCSIVELEDYVHEPTDRIRNAFVYSDYGRIAKLTDEPFLIVPDFRSFSRSFPVPHAKLYVLAKSKTEVTIENISLSSEDNKAVVININKSIVIDQSLKDTEYLYNVFALLSDANLDVRSWNSKENIRLSITFDKDGSGAQTKVFELHHEIYKEIAWAT